ncbi:precorrin-6y C5,15-methyltransferase (decarboxylating) subunit CbiE [Methanobrevibacter sp. 87.7]|uniref:cobalt-precorrin-7 (C(5))-methyltransferase n=1 Tax=Methanobrevibacter sp. 87.7 TaxID=387957 RepID=UPI000B50E286|nr:cobalt-precorrin-7 (C(5))-methyltransferase [Methanobrevibacter sp. 87.7]OWT33425.1 precorrin-6y C5,15-methyltransferase (decarboxylating) subunit CbiE [Methanobrevibacter sp. 87.7]
MSKLYIIGIGPGSKEYLTYKAVKTVQNADIVIGSQRAINLFDDINKTIIFNVKNLHKNLEESVDIAINGKNVALLSTGDPGFSGLLSPILEISKEKNFNIDNIEVIPGISSLQLASGKSKISWDKANIMTFHGRKNINDILEIIDNGKPTIALPSRKVKDMTQYLIDNGVNPERKVMVCERLSYPDEKIVKSTLKDISNSEFTYMCVMVIYTE